MFNRINNFKYGLLGAITTIVATFSPSLPAQAELLRYRFTSGIESIRLESEAIDILEGVGLSFDSVESVATPAPGFEYAWILLPPTSISGEERGTDFEFFYDGDTGVFIPTSSAESGTFEYNGSITFTVDQSRYDLAEELQIGEISGVVDDNLESFVIDTITTNEVVWEIFLDLENALVADLENQEMSFDPVDLFFTQDFADYLADAALDQDTADQVQELIPDLQLAVLRGDRTIQVVASVPESSSTLTLMLLGGSGIAMQLIRKKRNAN